ncbi:MAG: histidine kinase [Defluviitaleaceae bacterium]|nr:histidine kinase [Defluviitaleaceae bacterium]
MRISQWFHNLQIRHKLLLSFFVIPVILVLSIGFATFLSSTDALRRQGYDIIYEHQQSTIAGIIRNMNRYELIAQTITGNTTIQTFIAPNYITPLREYEIVRNVLNPTIHSFLDASESGINIQLIRYNDINSEIITGGIGSLLAYPRSIDFRLTGRRRQFQVLNYSRIRDLHWTSFAMEEVNTRGGIWAQVGNDRDYGYISFLQEITDMSTPRIEVIGLLRLTIMFDTIYTDNFNGTDGSFNLVFDTGHRLLSAEGYKVDFYEMNRDIFYGFLSGDDSQMLLRDQGITLIRSGEFGDNWHIVSIYPTRFITENVNRIAIITVFTFAIAGTLMFLLTFVLSKSFSKRINAIATKMQDFSSGEPGMRITGFGHDEIGFLGNVFNDMSEQISTLIYDNYISDIEKKDAQLKALQAQINPHILYNSLSSISRLAELGETADITNMVRALAKFYRMTLNRGSEIISIDDELSQIKAYLEVFRIRKGETFNVVFDVEDTVLMYQTLKIILQPFVENIFEHVIKIDGSTININITVRACGDDILFTVQDDGIGIPRDKLVNILNDEVSQGYGIINVNKRVMLQYGQEYGVSIKSEPGIGTSVSVRIPRLDMP